MKCSSKSSIARNQRAYGLIEVLIAVAILAGLAILIGQLIPTQQKTIFKTTERAECQNRLQNILSSIKKYDNQIESDAWLPGNGRVDDMDPSQSTTIQWASTRFTKNLMSGSSAAPVAYALDASGGVLVLPPASVNTSFNFATAAADTVNNAAYNPAEMELVRYNHLWQLSQNASTLLYRTCGSTVTVTQDGSFLAQQVGPAVLPNEKIEITVEKMDLNSGAVTANCGNWLPVPSNANPGTGVSVAVKPEVSVNQKDGLKVTARVSYHSTSSGSPTTELLACEGNTTVSPGSMLKVPPVNVNIIDDAQSNFYRVPRPGGPAGVSIPGSIACNPSQVTFNIGPSCNINGASLNCQDSMSYLCRLDYIGYKRPENGVPASIPFPEQSTGWFICSLPPTQFSARPATLPLAYINLSATNVLDDAGSPGTQNSLYLRLTGALYEGQYRLHVMATDRARNINIAVKDFQVDTLAPAITYLTPPPQIHAMGAGPQAYGHMLTFNGNAAMWAAMRTAFNSTPGENLFQCVSLTPNWTATSGGSSATDLNIAPDTDYGLAYGLSTDVLSPTCNTISGQPNITTSGHYKVTAIACDACGHIGGTNSRTWWADLNPAPVAAPVPIPVANMNNTVNGNPSPQTYRATLKALATLPVANTCEIYTGAAAEWSASLVGAGGDSSCTQTRWRAAGSVQNSCKSPIDGNNDICFVTYDGCGRGTTRDSNTNYQVLGAGSSASAAPGRDCCDSRQNGPACAPGFSCSNGSLTLGAPRCGITSGGGAELIWGPRPAYLSAYNCPVGNTSCACWQDSTDCNNNMTAASCTGPVRQATCEAPYTYTDTCPVNFIQSVAVADKNLYTSALPVPTLNNNDACTAPETCKWNGGGPLPTPTPFVLGTATGRVNNNFSTCNTPTNGPLGTGAGTCLSPSCPVLRNACGGAAPVPPPSCGAGEVLGCSPGPGWTSCDAVTTCGVPACPGNPSDYTWDVPAFDAAVSAQCTITPPAPACVAPSTLLDTPIIVPRVSPIRCMNGGVAAADSCCPGSRPADTTTCHKQSCSPPVNCIDGKHCVPGWIIYDSGRLTSTPGNAYIAHPWNPVDVAWGNECACSGGRTLVQLPCDSTGEAHYYCN